MTRIALVSAVFVLLLASPAAAQVEAWVPAGSAPYVLTAPSEMLSAATSQHRVGAALLATGLTANLIGAAASFYSIIASISRTYEADCVPGRCTGTGTSSQTDWGALVATSLATSGVGLVLFFIGLGLDIHAHVLRGRAGASTVALDGRGLTVTF